MNSDEENLNHDEHRVAELISTLKHVDAPANFNTRVRARIAGRREVKPRRSMVPVFAGVVTLALLAVVGYLGVRSLNIPVNPQSTETANTRAPSPAVNDSDQHALTAPTPSTPAGNGQALGTTTPARKRAEPVQRGGSIDEASKDDPKLNGRNLDPAQRKSGDTSVVGSGQVPISVMFDALGVHANWNGSGWQVESVREKSVAERGGVRAGDVIESIDGKAVGEKTNFNDNIIGRSLRVRRGGSSVEIPFKP
jgi:hypothetical protein